MKKSVLTLVGAIALAITSSGTANASITVALNSSAGGVYTYGISVDALESLNDTSYFTIYDFAGYEAGTIFAPAGWTATAQLLGTTPGTVNVPDSASLFNLTFSYAGSTLSGPLAVNGFGADSTDSNEALGWFAYQAIKTSLNTADQGDGNLEVPVSSVPEPISMSLLGGGLAVFGLLRFRRKN